MLESKDHLQMMHTSPRVAEEVRARWLVKEDRGRTDLRVYPQRVHRLAQVRGAPEVVTLNRYFQDRVGQQLHFPNILRPETLPKELPPRRLQGITGPLPATETILRWYRHRGMDLPEEYIRCHRGKELETYEHFMQCEQCKEKDRPMVRDQNMQLLRNGANVGGEMDRDLGKGGDCKGLWHMVIVKSL